MKLKKGDHIEWAKRTPTHASCGRVYPYAPQKDGEGEVVAVQGRDALVDMFGSLDWIYLPDMAWVRRVNGRESFPVEADQ